MKIAILGGGISGLSAAHFLLKTHPRAKITLFEKESSLGGWLSKGPRTFQAGKCPFLLDLISELGLQDALVFSDPAAKNRFLWHRGKLRSAGSLLFPFIPLFLREPFISASSEDESIYAFASRRFSPKFASLFFDPLTLGIYGGDCKKLSLRASFPKLYEWEKKGSLLKGMLFSPKSKGGLFSLRGGMGTLVDALSKLPIEIKLNTQVEAFPDFDRIYSALPGFEIARLTGSSFKIPYLSLCVVHLFYKRAKLPQKGFGYLIPSMEGERVLGMIWNSSIFPNLYEEGSLSLTAMVRGTNAIEEAVGAAKRHLGLGVPDEINSFYAQNSIPQFEVGYEKSLKLFEEEVQKKFPKLRLLGNFFEGPSVESCIRRSFKALN